MAEHILYIQCDVLLTIHELKIQVMVSKYGTMGKKRITIGLSPLMVDSGHNNKKWQITVSMVALQILYILLIDSGRYLP